MRAWIPAILCFLVFIYSCRTVYIVKHSYFPPEAHYKIDITVTGPDGEVIPAVGADTQ